MTSNSNIAKTGGYVSTVLEAEEQRPLTWRQQETFVDVSSPRPVHFIEMTKIDKNNANLKKKKANVKIVYVAANDEAAGQHRRVRSRICLRFNRKRKPEIVIALIAIFFLFVLISVVIMTVYFSMLDFKLTVGEGSPDVDATVTLTTPEILDTTPATFNTTPVSTDNTGNRVPDTTTTTLGTKPDTTSTQFPSVSWTTGPTTPVASSTPKSSPTTATTHHATPTSSTALETSNAPTSDVTTDMTSYPTSQSTMSETKTTTTQQSTTTKLVEKTTTHKPSTTQQPEPTTLYPEHTTIIEDTPVNVPIFYMSGPFTFEEAEDACRREGTRLALREDIMKAATIGYNRCSHGWLRDMHVAMIMQENYASWDCERGQVGAIYKAARNPDDKYSGAYCVKDPNPELDASELGIGSNPDKSINWWVTTDPMDAFNLRHALTSVIKEDDVNKYPLMAAMKSVYTCCNALNISYTLEENPKTFVDQRYPMSFLRKVVEIYHRELAPVKVFAHVNSKYETMMKLGAATTNRTNTIASLVELASTAGLDGLIMDYEPREEYTREHAATYVQFLNEFEAAMRRKNMKLGTVISSWGILKFYDVFNSSTVDFYGSMSSTYYGNDVSKNKENVVQMLNSINASRIEIGLGLMHKSELVPKPKRNYRWSEAGMRDFVEWIDERGISRIHVYPGHWRSHKTSEEYFLKTLSSFATD